MAIAQTDFTPVETAAVESEQTRERSFVLVPGNNDAVTADRWGGKAAKLAELDRLGARVPAWFGVAADAFEEAMRRRGLFDEIAAQFDGVDPGDDLTARCDQVRRRLEALVLPPAVAAQVEQAVHTTFDDDALVAVRSSASDEDGADHSFAGLHDSLLFVPTDEIIDAIRRVWASAFSERAVGYRLRNGLEPVDVRMAVVVQKMVDAGVSGVVFTVDPTSDDVETVIINSVWGVGEGLVGHGFSADSYRIDKTDGSVQREIVEKKQKLVLDRRTHKGLREEPVGERAQTRPTLNPQQVEQIGAFARRLEEHFRRPQDIEFCVDARGDVFWLQTRPVTTVGSRGPAAGQRQLWDNSNIIESYSGVTTPMTFSFIEHAYTIVYRCFAEVMGVPEQAVRKNMPVFENMLGLIRGEVYYNLHNWYRLIRMFPGFRFSSEFMESMMGVDESLDVPEEQLEASFFEKAADLGAVAKLVARSSANFARIDSLSEQFEEHFDEHYDRWRQLDFSSMRPDELMRLYWEMSEKLLWNWKAPIINDFYVMTFYGLLEKCCRNWCGDEEGSLQHDLICGEGGIATKEASRKLIELAKVARDEPAVAEVIVEEKPDEVVERLESMSEARRFLHKFRRYLHDYGCRSMEELKLEEPTMRERPEFIFQMIRNYLEGDDSVLDLEARRRRELQIRREAEQRAFGALNPLQKVVFRKILSAARRGVRNRENMRFKRTKIYGMVRQLLLAVADDFVAEGVLNERDDVFYLTIDELWAYVKGTAVTTDLKGLVDLRRAEFQGYRDNPQDSPDDRFNTWGVVNHGNDFRARGGDDAQLEQQDGVLTGTGCCGGTVTGEVKVIADPRQDLSLSGQILVAERTDPGWVPLYPSASGVLIERGSVLSHSAIVAREMGLPTIVGVRGLIDELETGDVVQMDGNSGTVRIV